MTFTSERNTHLAVVLCQHLSSWTPSQSPQDPREVGPVLLSTEMQTLQMKRGHGPTTFSQIPWRRGPDVKPAILTQRLECSELQHAGHMCHETLATQGKRLTPGQRISDRPSASVSAENEEEFLTHFKAEGEGSLSPTRTEGKREATATPCHARPSPTKQPTAQEGRRIELTSVLAHADLLFENVTETFAGIEKVQSTIYKLEKERTKA